MHPPRRPLFTLHTLAVPRRLLTQHLLELIGRQICAWCFLTSPTTFLVISEQCFALIIMDQTEICVYYMVNEQSWTSIHYTGVQSGPEGGSSVS